MRRAALALILLPTVVLSQTDSDIAHKHGVGHLEVTFAESAFALSLQVPAGDILGFEQPEDTDEDRALVAGAISGLSSPLELFVVPEEAACFTTAANVTLQTEGFGQTAEAEESDAAHHAEFQAEYQIECQSAEAIEVIRFAYFDRFPEVTLDRSGKIGTHTVTRSAPDLPF